MLPEERCPKCYQLPQHCRCLAIASDCSAADGGQSDVEATAGNPKRSADRRRSEFCIRVHVDGISFTISKPQAFSLIADLVNQLRTECE